jgi:hypothetical protein
MTDVTHSTLIPHYIIIKNVFFKKRVFEVEEPKKCVKASRNLVTTVIAFVSSVPHFEIKIIYSIFMRHIIFFIIFELCQRHNTILILL